VKTIADFASIYREYKPRIVRYLGRLVGEEDAFDLAQEVMMKVNQSLAHFRGESSLATWIYRIAANTAHDHRLSSSIQQRNKTVTLDDEDVLEQLTDHSVPGTEREYIRREMTSCIRGVVDQLPENYRGVLLLSDFEEFSNAEIAEILDLNLDTVKIRLHRARAHLKKALTCRCELYHDENNELACDQKVDRQK
jgi:RNA polymerase sigma-70 factor, ECF subfamily